MLRQLSDKYFDVPGAHAGGWYSSTTGSYGRTTWERRQMKIAYSGLEKAGLAGQFDVISIAQHPENKSPQFLFNVFPTGVFRKVRDIHVIIVSDKICFATIAKQRTANNKWLIPEGRFKIVSKFSVRRSSYDFPTFTVVQSALNPSLLCQEMSLGE